MLNRTNRTLTANLNRLNLGTRSLAFVAGAVNNVANAQRTILDHMRTIPAPIGILDPMLPSWTGSRWYCQVPSSPVLPGTRPVHRMVEVVADLPPDGREVVPVGDVPAPVPVGRPGGLVPRRAHAAKRRAAQAAAACVTAARASSSPVAPFATGG
jgi:hypothetical protein